LWLLIVVVIAAVVLVTMPLMFRARGGPGHEYVRSINNMRQIGLGLLEFEHTYGSLPNEATIALLREKHTASRLSLGTSSSNDYFQQLIVAELVSDKRMFYGYRVSTLRPQYPEDMDEALMPGECGFAYIITDKHVMMPDKPLVVYPLVKSKYVFDRKLTKLWGDRAAVLHYDGSVRSHPVDSSGRVWITGRDLFDPSQPFWNGRKPIVKWHE
jgi:hypothetical protein